jgi:16S rRNA processing protein RimM
VDELVAIARTVRTRGLRGELVAEVLTDFPERFDGLQEVIAILPSGERRDLKLANAWFQKDRVVLGFEGVNSVEKAEELRNADICVTEDAAVELNEGEFFDWQLEGCKAVTTDGDEIGTVRELMRTGAGEILVVVNGEGQEILIPFAEAICPEVDIENKRITVDPPEGLLEF